MLKSLKSNVGYTGRIMGAYDLEDLSREILEFEELLEARVIDLLTSDKEVPK
jgi:hypothetical protein